MNLISIIIPFAPNYTTPISDQVMIIGQSLILKVPDYNPFDSSDLVVTITNMGSASIFGYQLLNKLVFNPKEG